MGFPFLLFYNLENHRDAIEQFIKAGGH